MRPPGFPRRWTFPPNRISRVRPWYLARKRPGPPSPGHLRRCSWQAGQAALPSDDRAPRAVLADKHVIRTDPPGKDRSSRRAPRPPSPGCPLPHRPASRALGRHCALFSQRGQRQSFIFREAAAAPPAQRTRLMPVPVPGLAPRTHPDAQRCPRLVTARRQWLCAAVQPAPDVVLPPWPGRVPRPRYQVPETEGRRSLAMPASPGNAQPSWQGAEKVPRASSSWKPFRIWPGPLPELSRSSRHHDHFPGLLRSLRSRADVFSTLARCAAGEFRSSRMEKRRRRKTSLFHPGNARRPDLPTMGPSDARFPPPRLRSLRALQRPVSRRRAPPRPRPGS